MPRQIPRKGFFSSRANRHARTCNAGNSVKGLGGRGGGGGYVCVCVRERERESEREASAAHRVVAGEGARYLAEDPPVPEAARDQNAVAFLQLGHRDLVLVLWFQGGPKIRGGEVQFEQIH